MVESKQTSRFYKKELSDRSMSDSKKKDSPRSGLGTLGAALAERFAISPGVAHAPVKPTSKANEADAGKLVYSTDPALQVRCERCRELRASCSCPADSDLSQWKGPARLRLEKNGRGGKTVTVVDELPLNDGFLKEWTTRLKKKCGTGGTHRKEAQFGVIEIQGDHRDTIRAEFVAAGFKTKGN